MRAGRHMSLIFAALLTALTVSGQGQALAAGKPTTRLLAMAACPGWKVIKDDPKTTKLMAESCEQDIAAAVPALSKSFGIAKGNVTTRLNTEADYQGVTEAFIKNVLARANKEANAGFDLDAFRYEAFWDEDLGCMRMNLVSRRDQEISLAGREFYFARDEELHIEDSHKYTREEFAEIAAAGGFSVAKVFTDPRNLFSVQILTAGC